MFKKRLNFLNSTPTNTENVLWLLSAPGIRFDNKLPYVPFRYEH